MRFHHMALIVSDLKEAIHLWRDVLGFELQVEKTIPDAETAGPGSLMSADVLDDLWKVRGARSKMGWLRSSEGAMIELQQCESPKMQRTPPENLRYSHTGIHEIGLQVDNVDEWFARIREHGYETTTDYVWSVGDFAKSFLFTTKTAT
jgi:catechol 2,3-dioxygenase-like lactoylglutathione lyase family enzyme